MQKGVCTRKSKNAEGAMFMEDWEATDARERSPVAQEGRRSKQNVKERGSDHRWAREDEGMGFEGRERVRASTGTADSAAALSLKLSKSYSDAIWSPWMSEMSDLSGEATALVAHLLFKAVDDLAQVVGQDMAPGSIRRCVHDSVLPRKLNVDAG